MLLLRRWMGGNLTQVVESSGDGDSATPRPSGVSVIEIHERFSIPADPTAVWGIISDPHIVVGCVPGATLGAQQDDGAYDANVAVKFGPVKVTMNALVTLELDEPAMVGHVAAR